MLAFNFLTENIGLYKGLVFVFVVLESWVRPRGVFIYLYMKDILKKKNGKALNHLQFL